MVEQDFFPALLVMASFTLGPEVPLVLVVFFMALVALKRSVLELVVWMAILALHIRMFAQQWKMGFAVVEMGRFPIFFLVAVLAFRPQGTFVFIRLFVATDAFDGRLPVFLLRGVAILAQDFAAQVRTLQFKPGSQVVKVDRVQFCDACVPSFVFGMALFTWVLFLHQTMETILICYVFRNLLVTVFAQSSLGSLVVRFVAIAAFALVFDMPLYHLAGHQQIICRIGMCMDRKGQESQRAHLDECRFHATVDHLIFMNRNYVPDRTEYQHVNQGHMEYMP